MRSYILATHYDPSWYKAWHTWALVNFTVVNEMDAHVDHCMVQVPDVLAVHAGSISLGKQNSLQDTLRPLTLWFKLGVHDNVSLAIGTHL